VKIIPLREIFSNSSEIHAFVIGFFEVLCPWSARRPIISEELAKAIKEEYHYYLFGRGMAVIAWILIAYLVKLIFS